MSTEEKVDEIEASTSQPVSDSLNASSDETLSRLEDHRCAICQNIIINVIFKGLIFQKKV